MCNYTYLLLYYSPVTIIYKKLMSTYRMILPLSLTPYLIQRFLLPLLFCPLGKCRSFKKVPICILDRILDFNKYRQVKDTLILSSGSSAPQISCMINSTYWQSVKVRQSKVPEQSKSVTAEQQDNFNRDAVTTNWHLLDSNPLCGYW